ncbi:hypothetical protein K3495_g13451 [Podosphaera aphanis]|nr:hypothetical protein K3495_g13451 [Podosphaera aphanis]
MSKIDTLQALPASRQYGKHLTPDQSMPLSEGNFQIRFLSQASPITSWSSCREQNSSHTSGTKESKHLLNLVNNAKLLHFARDCLR